MPVHGDPVGQLAPEPGRVPGQRTHGEDADRLVADLVAVAVGAVQDVTAPAFGDARDVGQPVLEAGGDQHPPGPGDPTVGRRHLEGVPYPTDAATSAASTVPPNDSTSLRPMATSSSGDVLSRLRKLCR